MRETTPKVHLVARPSIDIDGMRAYLSEVGGAEWLEERLGQAAGEPNAAELLVEFAGRACYRSWKPGLNPNVTRVRTDQGQFFANLLASAHGSVLEHATYTFAFREVSRLFTHELVRHRAGSAFSQESLRYVRLTDVGFRVPSSLEPIRDQAISMVEQLEEFQRSAAEALGLDEDGVPFDVKKEVTSALCATVSSFLLLPTRTPSVACTRARCSTGYNALGPGCSDTKAGSFSGSRGPMNST